MKTFFALMLVMQVVAPTVIGREEFRYADDPAKCNLTFSEISKSIQTRITGGIRAERNMFPYQAGLVLISGSRIYQCGGSLIAFNFILTAAHCLYGSSSGRVFLGSMDFANVATAEVVIDVTSKDFIIHEKYVSGGGYDDIALIHLANGSGDAVVTLSTAVQTISLARKFMTQSFLEGKIVTASGWGKISDAPTINRAANEKLYFVDAPIMNQWECACFYLPGLIRSTNHICTDGRGGKSTCDGDSGGPLSLYYKNTKYLVGLTSFGSAGGCEIGFPSVYTRITNYLDWIAWNMEDKEST